MGEHDVPIETVAMFVPGMGDDGVGDVARNLPAQVEPTAGARLRVGHGPQ